MTRQRPRTVLCRDIHDQWHRVPVSRLTGFRPSVYGVVIRNGKVLLSRQWGGYDFPGGGIELGETIEHALVREVREETGLRVRVGTFIHIQNDFFKLPERTAFVQSILMFYACSVIGGRLSIRGLDANEKKYADMPEWVDLKKVGKLKFYNPVDSPAIIRRATSIR